MAGVAAGAGIVLMLGPASPPAPGQTIRLGGLVKTGTVTRPGDGLELHFIVTDMKADTNVTYRGLVPDLFREGQGVIATGSFDAQGVFRAQELLAKHDETYMPREVADRLKATGEWRPENGSPPTPGASRL